jgi:WD40 repeat protein
VRAGLVPALRVGVLPGSKTWPVVDMTPGAYPLEELEATLLRTAVNPPASLIEQLGSDDLGLMRAVKRVLPAGRSELVLIVDQLEELFTLVEDEALRTHVLTLIERAVRDPASRLRVIVTLRADFYDRPLLYRGFAELLREGVVTVAPLSPDEIERAISGPAGGAGVELEHGLLAEIVADVLDEPGALPLLQYALTELFERRDEGRLTRSSYAAIGGVSGALAGRAEELYAGLGPGGREAARQLFLQLVTLGEGADTSRRVARAQLDSLDVDQESLSACIGAFGSSRLLSFDRDPRTGDPTIEIAHEALLTAWDRLRGWVDSAREDLRTHRRLAVAAAEWEESNRDPSFLLRGSHLARFEAWAGESGLARTELERAYLEASLHERDAERAAEEARRAREVALERRSVNRLRAIVVVLAAAALVAAGLTVFAFDQSNRSKRQARIATARRLAAASVANVDVDPELSILLARQAVERAKVDGAPLPEAVDALHQALAASRVMMTISDPATTAVAFSPDGSRVATAGSNRTRAGVWDSRTGKRLLSLRGALAPIHDIIYSPDGSRLVGGSEGGDSIVWDARTGARLFALRPPEAGAGFTAVRFAPDGTRLATTDQGGSVRIWDLRTRRVVRTIRTRYLLCGISWSPDGRRVGAGQCGGSWTPAGRVWDVRTGRLLVATAVRPTGSSPRPRHQGAAVFGLEFSPDGRSMATPNLDGTARVWDARSGSLVATLRGHTGEAVALAYSPDGKLIATSGTDGTARVWDAVSDRALLVLHGHSAEIEDLAFAPDGRRLATASEDGTVRIWDVTPEAGRDWLTLSAHAGGVASVAYSPDGNRLVTSGFYDGKTKLWDARTGALVHSTPVPVPDFYPDAWDPDGRIHTFLAAATSPDGRVSAEATSGRTAATNGLVKVYLHRPDGTAQLLTTLAGRHQGVQSIEFSGDGKRIATGNWDGTAVLWDTASGRALKTIAAHNGIVELVAFSPDGRLLATAGDDTTAKIWDLKTGKRLLTLRVHTFALSGLAFSPDGSRLATASLDGTVRVYVLAIAELMAIARSRLTRGWTPAECARYLPGDRCPRVP